MKNLFNELRILGEVKLMRKCKVKKWNCDRYLKFMNRLDREE